ncbi:hypothetical protein [Leptolyngbya sp. PCC 6406]|uniref:hypothetical protein n=1 Tax=Leptolyngbya sp. PCC 6406 TaxID=1173264 RepID=UPI0002ABBC90|nr:hypothetical protein [Leptolyngbya sp. PCC 6406]
MDDTTLALRISVTDPQATDEDLHQMLTTLAMTLARQGAEVVPVAGPGPEPDPRLVEKGWTRPDWFDLKVDLALLKLLVGGLQNLVAGSTSEIKLEHEGTKLEFKVRGDRDPMADFQTFLAAVEATKQKRDG